MGESSLKVVERGMGESSLRVEERGMGESSLEKLRCDFCFENLSSPPLRRGEGVGGEFTSRLG